MRRKLERRLAHFDFVNQSLDAVFTFLRGAGDVNIGPGWSRSSRPHSDPSTGKREYRHHPHRGHARRRPRMDDCGKLQCMFTRPPARRRRPGVPGTAGSAIALGGDVAMDFVRIQPGLLFMMGSLEGEGVGPGPQGGHHQSILSRQGRGHPGSVAHGHGRRPSLHGRRHAGRSVSWYDCQEFLKRLDDDGPRTRFPPPDRGRMGVRLPRGSHRPTGSAARICPRSRMRGSTRPAKTTPIRSGSCSPIPGASTTYRVTSGNGARTGRVSITTRKPPSPTPRARRQATRRCFGAAASPTPALTAARPTAATSTPTSDTITTAFA